LRSIKIINNSWIKNFFIIIRFIITKIVNTTYDAKKTLEKTKHKYFESYKHVIEQEKTVIKILNDREKNYSTDEEVTQAHGILKT